MIISRHHFTETIIIQQNIEKNDIIYFSKKLKK